MVMPLEDFPLRKSALAVIQDMKARGAALDSLALNVALSTGVAADKAGVWGFSAWKSLK